MERHWLKQIREAKGLEQKDVANAIKKTQACYSYIESGDRNPTVKVAQEIAEFLVFDWTLFFPKNKKKKKQKEKEE